MEYKSLMRILIADDASDTRMLLSRILRNWGYDVITAEDGLQAWDILNREPIRLLISDWMMPEIDGMQLCRQIREHKFPHYVYVILLTGRDDESDVSAGLDAGADDFLTKPFNRDDLQMRLLAAKRALDLKSGPLGSQSPTGEDRHLPGKLLRPHSG